MIFPGEYVLTKCGQQGKTDYLGETPRWASCLLPDSGSRTFDPLTEQEAPGQRHGFRAMKKEKMETFQFFFQARRAPVLEPDKVNKRKGKSLSSLPNRETNILSKIRKTGKYLKKKS